MLHDETGHALVPSIVAYAEDGRVLVGAAARELLVTEPTRVVSLIKRLMGRGRCSASWPACCRTSEPRAKPTW